MTTAELLPYLKKIRLPAPDSHKGQNGRVMVIGGSELFHAASQWSLLVVSRLVDMVFYSSVPTNNELIKQAKEQFQNGIVIPRNRLEDYILESDVILIGPGMERQLTSDKLKVESSKKTELTTSDWNSNTEKITNYLVAKYPDKKWVVDAGALQMVDPKLLTAKTIITPHQAEFALLMEKITNSSTVSTQPRINRVDKIRVPATNYFPSTAFPLLVTCLLKGKVDQVFTEDQKISINGGNQGMTKGGTGDVLAGLVAGLYAFTDDPFAAAVVASYVNKYAGEELYKTVGLFFNATDLADQISKTLAKVFGIV